MLELYDRHPDTRVAKGLADIRYEIGQANRLDKQIKSSGSSDSFEDDDDDFDDFDF